VDCLWDGSDSQMCSMGLAAMDTNLMDESSKLVAVESIASGAILGTYEDTRFKSEVHILLLRILHVIAHLFLRFCISQR
jgi:hypothetical protein